MRITVRDKSSAVEQTFEVTGGVPVSSLLEQLAASLGAVIGPDEVIKPILERTSEALQLGRSLEENGVADGDVLLLARDSRGGGLREDRVREFEASLALIGSASCGRVAGRKTAPGRYVLAVDGIKGLRKRDGRIQEVDDHRIQITLTQGYPFEKPKVDLGPDMFHPNCWASGALCYTYRPQWSGTEMIHALLEFVSARTFLLERRPANAEATDWYGAHPAEVSRLANTAWPFRVPVVPSALSLARPVAQA
ncbi:MAG: ubiquitin-conjugating enzyme E2 [Coriobacteriia bacterium]|nr:ubiquitin-conjugating enzyme E2 [Coriobacteriia bacterium]